MSFKLDPLRPIYFAMLVWLHVFLMAPGLATAQSKIEGHENSDIQDPLLIHRNYKPVVGQPHVDFILPSIDGDKQIQLSEFRGKKVLLLHFASW
jgi:hypothetical protein